MQILKYVFILMLLIPVNCYLLYYGYYSLDSEEETPLSKSSTANKAFYWIMTISLTILNLVGIGIIYIGFTNLFNINHFVLWSIILGVIALIYLHRIREQKIEALVRDRIKQKKEQSK